MGRFYSDGNAIEQPQRLPAQMLNTLLKSVDSER
jgi:hypothetical protein